MTVQFAIRAAVGALVAWYLVDQGLGLAALALAGVLLAVARGALDGRRTATRAEAGAGAATLAVSFLLLDGRSYDRLGSGARVALGILLAAGLVLAGVALVRSVRRRDAVEGGVRIGVGTELEADDRSGRLRRVALLASVAASVLVAATAHQSGASMRFVPVWLLALAVTLQLGWLHAGRTEPPGRPPEDTAPKISTTRTVERAVAAAAVLVLAGLLAEPVAQTIEHRARHERSSRVDQDADLEGSDTYWGFQDQLDTSVRGELGDQEVLRVRSAIPSFWRATSYDRWDGRRWTRGEPPTTETFVRDMVTGPAELLTQEVSVRVRFGSVAVGASQLVGIDGLPAVVDEWGTWQVAGELLPGTRYDARSVLSLATPELLRRVDPSSATPPDLARYAEPLPTTDRVRDLTEEITAGATTDYDRIQALIGWIGDNVRYDRDSPVPPTGADAVDQFLFVDRVGFCEQIASALVVMSRHLGLPARLTTGFVPGRREGRDTWVSRGSDAHAWVEVYFPQAGWMAFDPTADVPLAGEFDPGPDLGSLFLRIVLGVALLAVVLGAALWWDRRRRRVAATPGELGRLVARFSAVGERFDGARRPNETLQEYARRLGTALEDDRPTTIATTLDDASYRVPPIPADETALTADLDALEALARRD